MAYISKTKTGKWRAQVAMNGHRATATFELKLEAQQWAAKEEAAVIDLKRGNYPGRTLQEAFERYLSEVSPRKQGDAIQREGRRFAAFTRDFPALAKKVLHKIDTPDMAKWRDTRLKVVSAGSVQRDINLLSNVFKVAQFEWHWRGESPFRGMRSPGDNPEHERMIGWREIRAMLRAMHYRAGQVPVLKLQVVGHAFILALRTGMRDKELLALNDSNVDLKAGVAKVPHKMQYITGKPREVPLTPKAVRLMRPLMGRGRLLHIGAGSRDTLFRKVREAANLQGFTFRDSRATALTHLSRRVDVLTLAKISGHRDIRTLHRRYYRESAASISLRLRRP